MAVVQPLISLETSASQPSESPVKIPREHHANNVDEEEDRILGHIPLQMAVFVSRFLKRLTNKGKVVIT